MTAETRKSLIELTRRHERIAKRFRWLKALPGPVTIGADMKRGYVGGLILLDRQVMTAAMIAADVLDLRDYDVIMINSSGGKDSQAMLDSMFWRAVRAGVVDRLVVVHGDLGRMEWGGTKLLARKQAESYGLPFIVANKTDDNALDLLQYIERRRKWPSAKQRYCTSDYKRGPVAKIITLLADRERAKLGRPVRVLNCMGLRAQESSARAKKAPIEFDTKRSSGRREVFTYHPILDWKADHVWSTIRVSGVEYHPAYDLGMPRLSCVFCVFAPVSALIIAGRHNPELLQDYIAAENRMGHTFRQDFAIASLPGLIAANEIVEMTAQDKQAWNM